KGNNFRRMPAKGIEAAKTRAVINLHVAAIGPAQVLELLDECRVSRLPICIVTGAAREHGNTSHPLALLCARGKRPPDRRTAKKCDELAPSHCLPRGSGQGHRSGSSEGR